MERRFRAFLLVAIALTVSAIVFAQVRVDVRLVNVVATVTDAHGRYIPNLTANDFILEEDGARQEISHFTQDRNVPVSVGILLDTSGSMDRKIRTAIEAVDRFIRRIHEDDEIFLITFSGQPILRQDFTGDRDKLWQALKRLNATGGTALYDALRDGLVKLRSGQHSKRSILVITDGQDTASVTKLDDILLSIRESELLVYPIGISGLTYAKAFDGGPFSPTLPGLPGTPALRARKTAMQSRRDEVDMKVLHAFAENSGGRAFLLAETLINRGGQIEKVLDTIADELRSQYTLSFYPSKPDDGRFHQIRVRTRAGDTVRARRGYFASAS